MAADWLLEEPDDFYFPPTNLDEPPELFPDEYHPPMLPSAGDYPLPPNLGEPLDLPEEDYPSRTPSPAATNDAGRESVWQLQHSGLLVEEVRVENVVYYEVGVAEIWQDPHTGDYSGAYLHLADAPHQERAEEMRSNIYQLADEAGVNDAELGDFAHGLVKGRGHWQAFSEEQWELVEGLHALQDDTPNFMDEPTWAAKDQQLAQTFTLAARAWEREAIDEPLEVSQVLGKLGLQAEKFDPLTTPPPLFDEATQTSYWIGVYQPDPTDPSAAITSLLSIAPDEHGLPVANLTPVTTSDLVHAQQSADYLLGIAGKTGDVAQVLEAAEGLALAHQQPELLTEAPLLVLELN